MFVSVAGIYLHKVLFVGSVASHFAGLFVGILLNSVERLCSTRNVENLVNLIERLVRFLAQCTCTLLAVARGELSVDLLIVIDNPLPRCSLFGV